VSVFRVRVEQCRFPVHGLNPDHLWPPPWLDVERGPITVSRLDNGELFVQDGRHRVIRARLNGHEWIDAVDHDDQAPAGLTWWPAPGRTWTPDDPSGPRPPIPSQARR
jgi:hypothetical protein